MRFRSLLSLVVVVPTLGAAALTIGSMYIDAQKRAGKMGERLLQSATAQAAVHVKAHSKHAADLVRTVTGLAGTGLPVDDPERLAGGLVSMLGANEGVTLLSYSTPDGVFTGTFRDGENRLHINQSRVAGGRTHMVETLVGGDGSRTVVRRDEDSGYDPRARPFYLAAKEAKGVAWSPPYVFYDEGVPGISCAQAVRGGDGQLRGIFSVDYDLNRLSELARQLQVSTNAQIMIFTADHVLVAHSATRVIAGSGRRGNGKLMKLEDVEDPTTRLVLQAVRGRNLASLRVGMPEAVSIGESGKTFLVCLTPVQLDAGPTEFVAAVAPASDFTPGAWESGKGAILIALLVSLGAAMVAVVLANRVSRPLLALVGAADRIGGGDFDVKVELGSLYEFKHLTDAFHTMLTELKDWTRMRLSLQVAMEIQRSLLPGKPPVVPGFDIAGYSAYCDETGGDYYDYIVIDRAGPQRFMVALGDVMGHGLPSALFMAGARGILRSSIGRMGPAGELLTHMNHQLYHDTGGTRFMTMGLTDFDLREGKATWASAGHDPPIVFNTDTREFCEVEGGDIPLGITGDVEYGTYPLAAVTGNVVLFLGSDGVWEMFSPSGEQFGKERVREVMKENCDKSAEEIKDKILAALVAFRGECPVKDDVTFVVMKTGPGSLTRSA